MTLFDTLFGHPGSLPRPIYERIFGDPSRPIYGHLDNALAQQQGLANYQYPKPRPRRMVAADIGMREMLVPLSDIPQRLKEPAA